MFIDPNELSEETFDKLVDLTLDFFTQQVGLLSEIGGDPKLIKYITKTFTDYDISVMIDVPHPEWWPDHDMYEEAENLGSENPDGESPAVAADAADDADAEQDFDDDSSLNNYIELSVVATPPSKDEDEESEVDADAEQVVLASILFPTIYLEQVEQGSEPEEFSSSIELQWLPEANTLD